MFAKTAVANGKTMEMNQFRGEVELGFLLIVALALLPIMLLGLLMLVPCYLVGRLAFFLHEKGFF